MQLREKKKQKKKKIRQHIYRESRDAFVVPLRREIKKINLLE